MSLLCPHLELLEYLDLSFNPLQDQDLRLLASLPHLQHLAVSGCKAGTYTHTKVKESLLHLIQEIITIENVPNK